MRKIILSMLLLCGSAWGTACPASYTHWDALIIQPQNNITAAQSSFPFQFIGNAHTATIANGGFADNTLGNGLDVIFCTGNNSGNLIAYEQVKAGTAIYSATTGAGEWWVLAPTVSNTAPQTIYVGIGKAGATDQSNAAAVWASYAYVQHFGTSSTLSIADSTGISTGTNSGATAVAGEVNGGAHFNSTSVNSGYTPTSVTNFTVEAWVSPTSASTGMVLSSRSGAQANGFFICYDCNSGSEIAVGYSQAAGNFFYRYTGTLGTSGTAFQYVAGTHTSGSANQVSLYFNGISATGGTQSSGSNTDPGTSTSTMILGHDGGNAALNYVGNADEERVSLSVRSADWIALTYQSIIAPACFYQVVGIPFPCGVTVLDQNPQVIQACRGTTTCVFSKAVTSGDVYICGLHSEGVLTAPTALHATFPGSATDSNTATNAGTWVWVTTASGSAANDTITLTGSLSSPRAVCLDLPSSVGSTVDVHSNGSFLTNGTQIFLNTAITTTTDGDFVFNYTSTDSTNNLTVAQPPLVPMADNGADSQAAGWGYSNVSGSYYAEFKTAAGNHQAYVTVALKPAAIIIDTASIPSSTATQSFSYCLQARGGAGAYTWSISSGALPTGLTLNSGTGCISGTPTATTTTPTFQVTDGTHTTTAALAVTINSTAATIGFVQSITSASPTFTSVAIGDCLEVTARQNAMVIPTDALGSIYKFVGAAINTTSGSSDFTTAFTYLAKATSAGADALTVTGNFVAAQYTNCQAFTDAATEMVTSITGVVTVNGFSITTPVPNSMIWASASGSDVGDTWTAGSGYTADGTVGFMQGEHQLVAAAGSTGVSFAQTSNATGTLAIIGLALRPTTSGVVSTGSNLPCIFVICQ